LIEYDTYLQKVKQVSFSNSNWVKFFYSSSGTLIKRTNSLGDVWAYTAKAIYKNGVLYQITQSEGRILFVANVWVYEFEYRDHQNNLRVAFKADGNQLVQTQTQEQDPFGLEIKPLSSQNSVNSNQYKFLNRQDIPELNGVSDLVNRFYDKQLGRFWSTDPITEGQEHLSLYQYGWNNPVLNRDPNGDFCIPCIIVLGGLLLSSQPAMAPSGGANAKREQVAYKQAYNSMGQDVLSAGFPVAKTERVSVALYSMAKREVKEEIKEQGQKQVEKVIEKTGRGSNHLQPDQTAKGYDHSTFRTDPKTGKITTTATYQPNPKNPKTGFDETKRVDVTGKPHIHSVTKEPIPTPHVIEPKQKNPRPARPDELPRQ
jgi:RHS repeat-associated protein